MQSRKAGQQDLFKKISRSYGGDLLTKRKNSFSKDNGGSHDKASTTTPTISHRGRKLQRHGHLSALQYVIHLDSISYRIGWVVSLVLAYRKANLHFDGRHIQHIDCEVQKQWPEK